MSNELELTEPVNPDVDLHVPAQRQPLAGHHLPVLTVVAVGGGLGTVARYGLSLLLPTRPDQFPWGTLVINTVGCLLIGVLMVLITEVWTAHRLVRPFLGVGVLGGFTTFWTYALEIRNLLHPGTVAMAFAYLASTFLAAMFAVLAGVRITRAVVAGMQS